MHGGATFLEFISFLVTSAIAFYAVTQNDQRVKAAIAALIAVWAITGFITLINFDQDASQFMTSKIRFCSNSGKFFHCWFSSDYDKFQKNQISQMPNENICHFCHLPPQYLTKVETKYIPVREDSLVKDDLNEIRGAIDEPIDTQKYNLGAKVGVSDITQLPASTINTSLGLGVRYMGDVKFDKFFGKLVSYNKRCLHSSKVTVLVVNDKVKTITWIGDIDKKCFDDLWLPNFDRLNDYNLDERVRGVGLNTTLRYFDYEHERLLIVSSRFQEKERSHVGLRISISSSSFPADNTYDEYKARGIFIDPDSIAAQ